MALPGGPWSSQGQAVAKAASLPQHCPPLTIPLPCLTPFPSSQSPALPQRFYGTAVGKGRQAAKNEIEKLKLSEMSCREGIQAVAKM